MRYSRTALRRVVWAVTCTNDARLCRAQEWRALRTALLADVHLVGHDVDQAELQRLIAERGLTAAWQRVLDLAL